MLVAPYLSAATLDRLAREGVSGIDLSGNGVVIVPGEWLVMRTGDGNEYPSSAPIKNIYRGRSSLVCRALLLRPEYPSVGAIVEALRSDAGGDTGVTQATVSKVLKTLEEELLVTRSTRSGSSRGSIRLTQPGELLDRLVRNYQAPKTTRALRGAPMRGTADAAPNTSPMAVVAATAEQAGVRYAIDLVTSYVPFPGSEETPICVESLAPIMDAGVIREDNRFATVRLIETSDPTAYFDTRVIGGTARVSPIQIYLELANGTKRTREIADALRTRILNKMSGSDGRQYSGRSSEYGIGAWMTDSTPGARHVPSAAPVRRGARRPGGMWRSMVPFCRAPARSNGVPNWHLEQKRVVDCYLIRMVIYCPLEALGQYYG